MKDETWITIKDFPLYEVSNLGRVRTRRPLIQTSGPSEIREKFFGWRILKAAKLNGYPAVTLRGETGSGIKRLIYIHRIVWEAFFGLIPEDFQIDHINKDRADNQLSNLRLATVRQNAYNGSPTRPNKTGYRGVSKAWNRFYAKIKIPNGKKLHLGSFATKEEAALAYNEAARHWHGQFATLNVVES